MYRFPRGIPTTADEVYTIIGVVGWSAEDASYEESGERVGERC